MPDCAGRTRARDSKRWSRLPMRRRCWPLRGDFLTRRVLRNTLPGLGRTLLDPLHDRLRRGRGEAGGETVSVELRAVNAKFCEVKARLPRELMPLEPELVKSIK